MALRSPIAATLAAILAVATQASAHAPAPMVPTALVEDVKSATSDIEFMDYVGNGQLIKLEPGDILILSYLKSCEHETITGGTVIVGAEHSDVRDGQIVRAKVPCDGGKMRLSSQQASKSAASAFRLQSADISPDLYARTPVIQLPKLLASQDRTLLIERTDRRGERHEIKIDDAIAAAGFYDLANIKVSLARGAIYDASIGGHKMTFQIDPKAKSGPAPIVSRLLRFQ
jgi:Cu/Ag efflux protein CusF